MMKMMAKDVLWDVKASILNTRVLEAQSLRLMCVLLFVATAL